MFHKQLEQCFAISRGIRLPKLELPKFGGEITITAFWQGFQCAIHYNNSLSGMHKVNYFINLQEGPAYRVVAGLCLSEENYTTIQHLYNNFVFETKRTQLTRMKFEITDSLKKFCNHEAQELTDLVGNKSLKQKKRELEIKFNSQRYEMYSVSIQSACQIPRVTRKFSRSIGILNKTPHSSIRIQLLSLLDLYRPPNDRC